MLKLFAVFLGAVRSAFGSRGDVALENLALRQQLATFACSGRRPRVIIADRWLVFLRNRDAIAAMDFFTVPTVTFGVPYVWFAIGHGRRRILHCDAHPTAPWVIQQLREAFPFGAAPRHFIFDRDSTFSAHVVSTMTSFGIQPTRTAFRSPWQNGIAERWIGSVRRELLNQRDDLGV